MYVCVTDLRELSRKEINVRDLLIHSTSRRLKTSFIKLISVLSKIFCVFLLIVRLGFWGRTNEVTDRCFKLSE